MDKLEDRIKALPSDLRKEVEEFLTFLLSRHPQGMPGDSRRILYWERERAFIRKRARQAAVPGKRSWKREELYE